MNQQEIDELKRLADELIPPNDFIRANAPIVAAAIAAVPELIAEVERLRGMVDSVEWASTYGYNHLDSCPFCKGIKPSDYDGPYWDGELPSKRGHRHNCPAFPPD